MENEYKGFGIPMPPGPPRWSTEQLQQIPVEKPTDLPKETKEWLESEKQSEQP